MEVQANDIGFINLECSYRNLDYDFKDLLIEYEIDFCTIISITQDTAVRLISVSTDDDFEIEYQYSEFFNYKQNKNNSIYQACVNEKIYINNNSTQIKPYFKDNKSEAIIPVKIDNELIACIGLSSIDKDITMVDLNKLNKTFSNNYCYINEIKAEKLLNKSIINYITLVDKLYFEKTQFMIQHSYNVASWGAELATELGYNRKKIRSIYLAGLMHDIGKIHIDSEIVNKEGKYTEEEYVKLKKHVRYSYNICQELFLGYHENISLWINQHHEKWDGSGYPHGLKGNEITREGCILKVADALDGMLSTRNYKSKMTINKAIIELRRCRGKDFDPDIIEAAISVLYNKSNIKHNIVNEFLMPASLLFYTKDKIFSLNGYVSKANEELVFFSNDDKNFEHSDVTSIFLAIEKLNVITEYKVSIGKFDNKRYTIDKISEKEHEKTFNLQWILEGNIVNVDTRQSIEIIITKLSAVGLSFKVKSDSEGIDENQTYLTSIIFEDGTKIVVMSKPVRVIKINNISHYELVFINIKEDTQAKIFHQLFQKQISMRNFI